MTANFILAFYHENDHGEQQFMLASYQMQSMPSLYQVTKDIFKIPDYVEETEELTSVDINKVRDLWSDANTDPNWSFVDDYQTPLKKHYTGQCKSITEEKPNIILIFAETLRAWDIPFFNHEMQIAHAPFVQSLANGTADFLKDNGLHARVYRHHITNGQPTIFAFMSIHTGLPPHSSQLVEYFVDTRIHGFPESLRAHGYATQMVLSGNTEFDSKVLWARRWYGDTVSTNSRDDRISFARLADFVRANVKAGKPYFGSLLTITNHLSYFLPEGVPSKLAPDAPLIDRMYETLAYDDAAIREFLTNLAAEGLLHNTVVIITGDHGFEFGEYSEQKENTLQGYATMKHNANWVPLIIISDNPEIQLGTFDTVSSHADIAPTILHLAGICDDNNYLGHSLFSINENNIEYAACGGSIALENNLYSSIFIQSTAAQLYKLSDATQRNDIAADHPDIVSKMKADAMTIRKVIDDVYIHNKF
ncbi:MAG: sulfatase-like hydrolase/transferase [Proteobacteria bacterium]|nr:sulfatase-like hydrolase/transferase [Pseudomonadota bacterium]